MFCCREYMYGATRESDAFDEVHIKVAVAVVF